MDLSVNQSDLISIIIPVYNVENYLERCVDSVLQQSYSNFEIILIDDGSKDNSGKICDELVKKDSRISAYHIPNGGVGNARNYGLTKVHGAWYTFVDSDDWIEVEYLMTLYRNAIQNNCDVSACGYVFNSEYSLGIDNSQTEMKVLENSVDCIRNFISPGLSLNGMSTLKLYRYEKFKNVQFDTELKVNEDCKYTFELFKICDRACVTSDRLYHWFVRSDSACHSKPTSLNFSAADVFIYLLGETEYLKDDIVEATLKRNYIISASNVLFYVPFNKKDQEVKVVLQRLKTWKKDKKVRLNRSQKIKLWMVLYAPFLTKIAAKM